jgi:hypothetical protein
LKRARAKNSLSPARRIVLLCFALVMACFLLAYPPLLGSTTALVWHPIALSEQAAHYQSGHCTISSKTLLAFPGMKGTTYSPHFTYVVHTIEGKNYKASGYGFVNVSTYRDDQQTILDSYQVNTEYPCWYDPGQPSHAVLNKDTFGPLFISFVMGLFFSILIALMALFMLFLIIAFIIGALFPRPVSTLPATDVPKASHENTDRLL